MCLYIKDYNRPTEVQKVYKIVLLEKGKLYSLIKKARVKFGWYKASFVLSNKVFNKVFKYLFGRRNVIEGGAIHVYNTWGAANYELEYLKKYYYENVKMLVCDGYPKHFIANGYDNQSCYTKIFIPKESNEFNST